MMGWEQVGIAVAVATGLVALVRSFISQGKADAGTAVEAMAQLAGELRTEITRKQEQFDNALAEERKQCADDMARLQGQIDYLTRRIDNGGIPR